MGEGKKPLDLSAIWRNKSPTFSPNIYQNHRVDFDTLVLSMYIFKSVLVVFRDELIILVICTAVVGTGVRGATTNLINL